MTNIVETTWLGQKAIQLDNEYVKAVVLPACGGKTASLIWKENGFELIAQNKYGFYRPSLKADTPFGDCDASGFDDAFPTIAESSITWGERAFSYTDHGEIWRSSFAWKSDGERITLTYNSRENPFTYIKTISLCQHRLKYDYHIANTGGYDWPCMWTMHGLVRYEEDMRLIYPQGTQMLLNVADSPQLGADGSLHSIDSAEYNFRGVPNQMSHTMVKYYLSGKTDEGCCGYEYPSQSMRCIIEYDSRKLPYLGFWVTAGGYRGDYNCAFEPSNGFYDGMDTAQKNNACYILKKGQSLDFSLTVGLLRI